MGKKILYIFPLVVISLVVLVVAYLITIINIFNVSPTPTSTPRVPETLIAVSDTVTPSPTLPPTPTEIAPTATSLPIATATSTPNPTAIKISKPQPTAKPTSSPAPTSIPSPTPIVGLVKVANLNVRWGPSTAYGFAGAVYEDDKVVILGRHENWLKIETPNQRTGWVSGAYIDTTTNQNSFALLAAPPLPSERPIVASTLGEELNFNRELDIEGRSVLGKIAPYGERWYSFFEYDPQTVVTFIFTPNVNFFGENFSGKNTEFFLYDENQIPVWPPGDANGLPNIGSSEVNPDPGSDRDGDLRTGELIWRGGPLIPGVRYYLRFVNYTPEEIEFCLAPGDVRNWTCSRN